jgi:hypothetical protein
MLVRLLKTAPMLRFYAIVVLLFSFVFLNIPRIDFSCAACFSCLAVHQHVLPWMTALLKNAFFLSGRHHFAFILWHPGFWRH